jgi:hypothetical protein
MFITYKALKEVFSNWRQDGVNAFLTAGQKGFVGPVAEAGIKWLSKAEKIGGITYTAQIKVTSGPWKDYRILGYTNKAGQWVFDFFTRGLGHK